MPNQRRPPAVEEPLVNPLPDIEPDEVVARCVQLLSQRAAVALPPPVRFAGPGVYAIFYGGGHPLYASIGGTDQPLYVGKASKSRSNAKKDELWHRLFLHGESIKAADDLNPADFTCRYLPLDGLYPEMVEVALLRHFAPVWNALTGFGSNPFGEGRKDQATTEWDQIHTGRHGRGEPDPAKANSVSEKVLRLLTSNSRADLAELVQPPAAA